MELHLDTRSPSGILPPLVVDLDGTLSAVDTLHESAFEAILSEPSILLRMVPALGRGKAALKELVSGARDVAEGIPLREEVLDRMREASREGRRVVLATGAHRSIAEMVAARAGCVDEILATEGETNLVSEAKAARLVEIWGEGGFDYVGDSRADVAVWKRCRQGFVVGTPGRCRKFSASSGKPLTRIATASRGKAWWKILRPHQWLKNLLVFLPLLASHRFLEPGMFAPTAAMFAVFCLAASCVYVANDLFDRRSDRRNPSKSNRPLASGTLSIPGAMGLLAALGVALVGVLSWMPWTATGGIAVYLAANIAYTIHLKRRLLVDIFLLAFMYVWRVFTGGLVTGIESSAWLLGFSGFLFLSLAFAKRYAEVVRLADQKDGQAAGRAWRPVDAIPLGAAGMGAGVGGSILLALYVTGSSFASHYRNAQLTMLLSPLFLYWITRIWIQAYRKELHEDPVLFAARDKVSYLVLAVAASILVAATF